MRKKWIVYFWKAYNLVYDVKLFNVLEISFLKIKAKYWDFSIIATYNPANLKEIPLSFISEYWKREFHIIEDVAIRKYPKYQSSAINSC